MTTATVSREERFTRDFTEPHAAPCPWCGEPVAADHRECDEALAPLTATEELMADLLDTVPGLEDRPASALAVWECLTSSAASRSAALA